MIYTTVETKKHHLYGGGGVVIPFDVADGITVACLQEQLAQLQEEVRAHKEDGDYMHPEDYVNSTTVYIPALQALIPYFGGQLQTN
jgi:hypothetical protein